MTTEPVVSAPPRDVGLAIHKVFAVAIGSGLEFYDFLTFSFFAVQIGHTFFPAELGPHGLLLSLATFGVGFVTRPLGGFVIGRLGDRVGRKPAMLLSFGLMGITIIGLALIPSYATIGIAAPILLVACRLLQGFALGGEVGPSTAFLVEAAPLHRRGLYVSLQFMTQDLAVLSAGLVGFILSNTLTLTELDSWGWRVAFLLGAAIVPIGLFIRRRLPETHDGQNERPGDGQLDPGTPASRRLLLTGLVLLAGTAIYLYGVDYITTFAQDSLRMTANAAFGATIILGISAAAMDPLSGLLTDRVGRRPVMLVAVAILLLSVIPAYWAMTRLHSVTAVYLTTAFLGVLQSFLTVPALVTVTESLPKSVRSGLLGMLYAVSMAIFGGTTQFMLNWLTGVTGSGLAPAWYISGALALVAIAMILTPETAPGRRSRLAPRSRR